MEGEEQNSGWNNFSARSNGLAAEESGITNNAPHNYQELRRKERFRSILVIVVGVGALFFGLIVFYFNLSNPFLSIMVQAQKDQAIADEQQRQALLVLQTQDTDKDGLFDYEELNTYSTSPYLADSDSDGINDKDEVTRGTDPNCPEGQSCFSAGSDSSSTGYVAPSLNANLVTQQSPTITVTFIRQMMKDSGMTDADLNSLSDQEIMSEFATYLNENPAVAQALADEGYDFSGLAGLTVKTVKSTSTASTVKTATTTAIVINTLEDLNKLSGAQIRQWLIASDKTGKLADSLVSATDDQLKALVSKEIETRLSNQ